MITSLQNFFLKHNKWLFGGLLVVVIVTFVLTIGPQNFFGSGGGAQRRSLKFFGYDLSSESDQRSMAYTAEISAILHPELGVRRDQLMDYAYLRLAGLGMADQIGVPQPGKDQLADYVATLRIFADPQTGSFSAESYNRVIEALLAGDRYDRESIAKVLREDYRIRQLSKALGGPDYSLPYEVRQDFLEMQTRSTVVLATYDYNSFTPEITPAEDALLQFFNENPARYEIPESITVSALLFKADAYLNEVADPAEADLEAYFAMNTARYEAAREKPEGVELPELTLADVREQAIADWKRQQAVKVAAKKGEQFSLKLWQQGVALDSPEFAAMVDEFRVQTQDIPSYSRNQPPRLAQVPAQLLNSMWVYASNPSRYFSDIAQNADGAVVLVKRSLTPARMPAFEEVRAQVTDDYLLSEKRRLFAEKGNELYAGMTARLGSEAFTEIATELGLKTETLEPFTGASVPPELLRSTVWDQARYLPAGGLTRMVINGETGTFAYISEKVVPEIDENSAEYQAYLEQRSGLGEMLGLARLREIKDNSLTSLLGPGVTDLQ